MSVPFCRTLDQLAPTHRKDSRGASRKWRSSVSRYGVADPKRLGQGDALRGRRARLVEERTTYHCSPGWRPSIH
jgi:hypothetical protein